MQRFEADVSFDCPACGEAARSSTEVPEPDWASAESSADLSSEGETLLSCDKCGEAFDAHVSNQAGSCEIKMIDFPQTIIRADQAFFSPDPADDWIDRIGSDDALHVFTESIAHSIEILDQYGSDTGFHLINRMVFAHLISAWEAYLSDTARNIIDKDATAIARLVSTERTLSDKKYSLSQIDQDPALVIRNVRDFIDNFIFHNIPKVMTLYKIIAKVDIKPSDKDIAHLQNAIQYRHDCVHRNGYDVNKNRVEVFTDEYIKETADVIRRMVNHIDTALYFSDPPW